jgi:hypothetical protein
MATAKDKTSDALAEVLAGARAAAATRRYAIADNAKRGRCADGKTTVALGALATGKLAGEEALVWENGTAQSALPYHVILVAIRDGVIPRATINALLGNAEAGA